MKFILNTTFDPHFCVLFDNDNKIVDSHQWITPRKDGIEVWRFLKKNNIQNTKLSFLGGISGPGSFSSLRTSSTVLNSIALTQKIPVHFIRADWVIAEFLKQNKSDAEIVLNTFGDAVFVRDEKQALERITLEDAAQKFKNTTVFVSLLPEKKQAYFPQKISLDLTDIENICLHVLEATPPQKMFIPDYECPPVG